MTQAESAELREARKRIRLLEQENEALRRAVTREELRLAIVTWSERTYHRRRRQHGLGKLTPIEFETINSQTALAG